MAGPKVPLRTHCSFFLRCRDLLDLQAMLAAPVAMKSGSAHTHPPNSHGNHGYPQVYVGKPGLITSGTDGQDNHYRYQQMGKKLGT